MVDWGENDISDLLFPQFCEKYLRIHSPLYGWMDYKLHRYQKDVADEIENKNLLIINKFRRSGMTTLALAYALWKSVFNPKENFMFLSKDFNSTKMLSDILRHFIGSLPKDNIEIVYNDFNKLVFQNGSSISFHFPNSLNNINFKHLFIDEATNINDMENAWGFLSQNINIGAKCTIYSSQSHKDTWYYNMYYEAMTKISPFKVMNLHFMDHPEFGHPGWVQSALKVLGYKEFLIEIVGVPISNE